MRRRRWSDGVTVTRNKGSNRTATMEQWSDRDYEATARRRQQSDGNEGATGRRTTTRRRRQSDEATATSSSTVITFPIIEGDKKDNRDVVHANRRQVNSAQKGEILQIRRIKYFESRIQFMTTCFFIFIVNSIKMLGVGQCVQLEFSWKSVGRH